MPDALTLPQSPADTAVAPVATQPVPEPAGRLWTPLFTVLAVSNFAVSVIFYLLTSTISGWAMTTLGASAAAAGLLGTAWFVGAMLSRVAGGLMIGRLGQRATTLGALAALLLGALAYPMTHTLEGMLVLRLLHGMAFGVAATALTATAMSRVPALRRGEGSAWFSFGMALAGGCAPFLGHQLQHGSAGQRGVFWTAVACAVVALGLALVVAARMSPRDPATAGRPVRLADVVEPKVLPVAAVVMLCALGFGALLTLVGSFGEAVGLGGSVGFYFLAYSVAVIVSRPFVGKAQDRFGDTSVLFPVAVLMVLAVAMTALAHSPLLLLTGGALLGLGYGTLLTAGQTVALNLVGSRRAGVGIATYYLLVDVGTGLGPFVIGALVDPLGFRAALMVAAGLACLALVGLVLLRRRLARLKPTL